MKAARYNNYYKLQLFYYKLAIKIACWIKNIILFKTTFKYRNLTGPFYIFY